MISTNVRNTAVSLIAAILCCTVTFAATAIVAPATAIASMKTTVA